MREKLVEGAAEADDALADKYLEGEDLTEEEGLPIQFRNIPFFFLIF